jgi:hypothetical protein
MPQEINLIGLFQNQPAKITAVALSSIGTFICTPILIIIIKYEKDKHYKSLINKLVYFSLYVAIIQGSVTQLLMYLLYIFGPLPELICYYDLVTRPGIVMYDILFLDAIFVLRYLFVFHSKIPTTKQEEFWCFYLNVWMISFCFISHLVFAILPGNNPNFFYICLGKIPHSHHHNVTKINLTLMCTLIFSIFAHVMVGIKYQIFVRQEKNKTAPTLPTQMTVTHDIINKSSMATFTTNCLSIFLVFLASAVPQKINTMDLKSFNNYPDYLWAYIFHLYLPPFILFAVVLIFFLREPQKIDYFKALITKLV